MRGKLSFCDFCWRPNKDSQPYSITAKRYYDLRNDFIIQTMSKTVNVVAWRQNKVMASCQFQHLRAKSHGILSWHAVKNTFPTCPEVSILLYPNQGLPHSIIKPFIRFSVATYTTLWSQIRLSQQCRTHSFRIY